MSNKKSKKLKAKDTYRVFLHAGCSFVVAPNEEVDTPEGALTYEGDEWGMYRHFNQDIPEDRLEDYKAWKESQVEEG